VSTRRLGLVVPDLAVGLSIAAVIAAWAFGMLRDADVVLVGSLVTLGALGAVHRLSIALENHALTTHLEARVAQRTAELDAKERYFHALVQHSSDVIVVVDAALTVTYVSDSVMDTYAFIPDQLVGRHLDGDAMPLASLVTTLGHALNAPAQLHRTEIAFDDGHGRPRSVDCTVTNLLSSPDVAGYVINCRDVTERASLEGQLRHQAFHDPLTGLANRALFADRLAQGLARNERTGKQLAVLVIDLDGFKNINDSLGHSAGDRVLSTIAGRLLTNLQSGDTVARLGGDEFAVLVEDLDGPAAGIAVAQRLSRLLRQLVMIDGQDYRITASIGIAVVGVADASVDDLLRDADTAMYEAKNAGKDTIRLFEPSMHDHARERFRLQSELQGAVQREEFTLHYQPSFDLATGDLEGFEALVRWEHPDLGLVPPNRFIPLAEETGLIVPLGRWVLRQAAHQLAAWSRIRTDGRRITMSINVSARQMQDPGLVDDVRDILAEAGVDPRSIVLEITESMLLHDADAVIAMLDELKAIGVRIAIDDFGTGYASLSYLRRLPVDILKVDKSFLTDPDSPDLGESESLLSAILNLGKTLGLRTVAEGIEQAEQMVPLRRGGCDSGQGYLFARPLPAAQAETLVNGTLTGATLTGATLTPDGSAPVAAEPIAHA
jgi:diguanylate cyclase (GGDEF)-like protein/PAS domain S-box-containing protein